MWRLVWQMELGWQLQGLGVAYWTAVSKAIRLMGGSAFEIFQDIQKHYLGGRMMLLVQDVDGSETSN